MTDYSMSRGAVKKRAHLADPANRQKNREYMLSYSLENPLKYMPYTARRRAKLLGLEFSITEESFPSLPTHCPALGIELHYGRGRGKRQPNSASLDRDDSSKGYVPGNVSIISWRANDLKGDGTLEELEAVVAYMRASSGGVRQGSM